MNHRDPINWSSRLDPGETVLWQARASVDRPLSAFDIPIFLFGVLFLLVGFGYLDQGSGLAGLPVALVGMFLVWGQFGVAKWLRTGVVYALTERRALLWRTGWIERFRSVELRLIDGAMVQEHPFSDGRSSVTLGRSLGIGRWLGPLWPGPAAFHYIDDAPAVARYIRGLATAEQFLAELDEAAAQRALEARDE